MNRVQIAVPNDYLSRATEVIPCCITTDQTDRVHQLRYVGLDLYRITFAAFKLDVCGGDQIRGKIKRVEHELRTELCVLTVAVGQDSNRADAQLAVCTKPSYVN